MIARRQVEEAVEGYLARHPEDKEYLAPLVEALETGEELAMRERGAGHVTCGGIVVNRAGEVLQILHGKYREWFFPGGHAETQDQSLVGAAAREVVEETGLEDIRLLGSELVPVHIGMHEVWGCRGNEGEVPWHFDFRYLFECRSDAEIADMRLQLEEVSAARWLPPREHSNAILRKRIADALCRYT